ncbi:hypothetical protein ALP26_100877 [Pseudomonas savastanoi pv. glycinea]|uniref:Uncharacterized protein n=2 Tax=Pseudomonas savastanoi TaxID=29438 RepID=A0A3M5UB82_PSESG|nr:Unknown protein sequence [Pseudomonas savastanoi pv. phaseolicola]KPB67939.1 Unknown protein sequence [Pseudomonas amygdali pv. mellea]KPB85472.1 Unknown protein sequence [Pseudomonas syringae pv. maculicola]KPC29158.1 Unknown protein sequence [Pseudomonas savastanoi pv. glycinea]KPB45204.1 Unknown protein sequence [Pseudomonas savastanoi pv. phaseolicola]
MGVGEQCFGTGHDWVSALKRGIRVYAGVSRGGQLQGGLLYWVA